MHLNVRGDPLLKSALTRCKNLKNWKKSYDYILMGTCHKDKIDDLEDWLYTLKYIKGKDEVLGIDFKEFPNNPIHVYQDQVAYEVYIREGTRY